MRFIDQVFLEKSVQDTTVNLIVKCIKDQKFMEPSRQYGINISEKVALDPQVQVTSTELMI